MTPEQRADVQRWIEQPFNTPWVSVRGAAKAALAEIDRQEARIDELEEIVLNQNFALASARNPVTAVHDPIVSIASDVASLIRRVSRLEAIIEHIHAATEEEE